LVTALHRIARVADVSLHTSEPIISTLLGKCQLALVRLDCGHVWTPRSLSNSAWSVSKLSIQDEPLMSSIAERSSAHISEYIAQELSNTAWSLSVFRLSHVPLLEALSAPALLSI